MLGVKTELKKISFFENLNEKELNTLASFSKKKTYSTGKVLFYEGEDPKTLTILTKGILKLYKTDMKNNEVVLHRFRPVSMIAEMATFKNIRYPASASFLEDGSVVEIDFEKFKTNFFQDPDFSFSFFVSLSEKIINLERVISLNIVLNSTSRVAKYIYDNKKALSMKHSCMAEDLHMTPETLSRIFKKLSTLGLIEKTSKEYKIKNEDGLKVLF